MYHNAFLLMPNRLGIASWCRHMCTWHNSVRVDQYCWYPSWMCSCPTYLCAPHLSTWLAIVIHGIFSLSDLLVVTLPLPLSLRTIVLPGWLAQWLLVYLWHLASWAYLMTITSNYTMYHIDSIRRRGYYLFHHAILCGFYLWAATIWKQHIKLGMDDEEIHCLKEGGVTARESTRRDTATLATATDTELEESDPFVSSCYCKLVPLTSEFTAHGLPSECLASWTSSSCQSVVSDFINPQQCEPSWKQCSSCHPQANPVVNTLALYV